jgi:OTU domain-containing protein 6
MDELLTKHRKEQRDLQSKITQKKKNATKKTRKGVNDECETLERELKERQKAELDGLNGDEISDGVNGLSLEDQAGDDPVHQEEIASAVAASPSSPSPSMTSSAPGPKKRNRQKERLARRVAEQDTAIAAAEEEAASMPDQRDVELKAMAEHTSKLGLTEIPIRPDGHCLFAAIATSLPTSAVESGSIPGYQNVRSVAADFIATHPDDFSAFLEEPIDAYTRKIRDTAEWGGAVELQALSRALGRSINVLQSDGRVERIGEGEEIWLAYYRHSFGLGEHYNALKQEA